MFLSKDISWKLQRQSKVHMYANMQMKTKVTHWHLSGTHSQTRRHTQWGLENCHACWHCHVWRMALSTVLYATKSQRVCERSLVLEGYLTMIQEGWLSHRGENNTPARSMKTDQKTNTARQEMFLTGWKGEWMTDSLCSSLNDNMNKLFAYLHARMHFCILFYHLYIGE